MKKNKIFEKAIFGAIPVLSAFGFNLIEKYLNSLEIKAKPSPLHSANSLSESAVRYQRYKLENIHDSHIQLMYDNCNKAIGYLETENYELSLFYTRKVIEHILVLLVKINNLHPAKSYRSAKNFKICIKNGLIDEETADAISKCRNICGNNTHQLGYENLLTRNDTEAIVKMTCHLLESITDINKPIYEA